MTKIAVEDLNGEPILIKNIEDIEKEPDPSNPGSNIYTVNVYSGSHGGYAFFSPHKISKLVYDYLVLRS